MKTKKFKLIFSFIFSFLSFSAFSSTNNMFNLEGRQETLIKVKNKNFPNEYTEKEISLMKITTTPAMKLKNKKVMDDYYNSYDEQDYTSGIVNFSSSPSAVDLGMENLPVLDQGKYGTCVTFSSTAALDAKLATHVNETAHNDPDLIDQQCILSLNKYLGVNLWNGAKSPVQVLEPLKKYGIIEKNTCNNNYYPSPNYIISSTDYSKKSIKNMANLINYYYLPKADLSALKDAINNGNRVLIGVALANFPHNKIAVNGFDMLVGTTYTSGGLWACRQPQNEINYCPPNPTAGHEIIVIGYDDNQHLLKIRNSWGEGAGESGDFYMTYTFFEAMALDQTEIL